MMTKTKLTRRSVASLALALLSAISMACAAEIPDWGCVETAHFHAPEATQGVAVDADFFYAIGNREIGKYRKSDGVRLAHWQAEKGGPFVHLNAGVVEGRKLYVAHSNFPEQPMRGSVEIWDTRTLRHIGRHDFGETDGSLTWVDKDRGVWYANFAQYRNKGGAAGRGPEWTRFVELDANWHAVREWRFPLRVVKRFGAFSSSGGGFGPLGHLYATGHDAPELYVFDIPAKGTFLKWRATVSIPFEGQAFAWDPSQDAVVYGISRKRHEVIACKISTPLS